MKKSSIREMTLEDIPLVVDYFVLADEKYLYGMGALKNKLLPREEWIRLLQVEIAKPYIEKEFYYLIWLIDNQPVGHSNVNNIHYGDSATMHLHVWDQQKRMKGMGVEFLKKTIPLYFEKLMLKKLICEPYSQNVAPNKTLSKLGFTFIRAYETVPGWINYRQVVNRYELTAIQLKELDF